VKDKEEVMETPNIIQIVILIVVFVFGCFVGANNPQWFSDKWKEIKKTAELAKEKEGRDQIIKDAIAEYERMKQKVG
jgi:uncharacterized membrane protein